ncbi:S8 family serine peptidase [Pseudomonas sp. BP8]|uniref:S8 family serine peptidase n=1 Tax=Pseudomonas sp. BP8 TaxID=2817864 RepID=UPI001AE20E7D|nr:S8 family serine peptidase [Pseudomonas sp. BP8]MBP2260153.1 subtilisin-like proprotein convertase family protein [Pseudomonas sp. BP8]HDS1736226.1 S8 family serine peptidase [Pseudomonas putida]
MSGLVVEDVNRARRTFESEGAAAMYDYLAGKGDRYALLANGVAKGNSIAGLAAIGFMKRTEEDAGRPMQQVDVEQVRLNMAKAYLDLLEAKASNGKLSTELSHKEVWDFHSKVFERLGRSKDAWTLNSVFELIAPESREAYWQTVLRAAGSPASELWLSIQTDSSVSNSTALAPEHLRPVARYWKARIDSPEGVASFIFSLAESTGKGIASVISDFIDSEGSEPPSSSLKIDITPATGSSRYLMGEDDFRNNVSNGFVDRNLTHSIAFTDKTLDNTDFTSAQIGSLTTGGIRPGELQLDPNVRPNQHLAQFYRDGSEEPDFSLRNAVVLNGLAAMTTVNTFVDPLLLDLSGEGVGLTGIEEGVLFDVDNSGSLRRTGWADRKTGMLVHDDGTGLVSNISQLFSEYYGGKAGSDANAGETPFKDGFAALASVDANSDGAINFEDPIWSQLKVWVDGNHDGRADAGELKALQEHGITQIRHGQIEPVGEVRQGNQVISRGAFTLNGADREILAVKFLADTVSNQLEPLEGGTLLTSASGPTSRRAYISQNRAGTALDASLLGVDTVYGAVGDDVLTAAPAGSWLIGGGGSNTYVGGIGDDVFVVSASDDQANIRGNGGRDTALIVGEQGVGLNMAKAGLSVVQGGRGRDIIASGGQRGVFIKGGSGDSLLIGGGGNDVLVGGVGRNNIIGGTGKSVIYAGPKGDRIQASAGGSIIYAGGGADLITGSAADDVIEAGRGDATINGGEGVDLVKLHGTHDEYLITRTASGFQISDTVPKRDGRLTLSNIQNLGFADIASIDLLAPAAMPISDTLGMEQMASFTVGEADFTIPAAVLLENDQLLASAGALRIATVTQARGAIVHLDEQGNVRVAPLHGHVGNISFRYDVVDGSGNPSLLIQDVVSGASAPLRALVTLRNEQSPSDPLVPRQWYLGEIDVQPIWADYTGKGIRIGQFEPGGEFAVAPEILDIQHPDLQENIDSVWLQTQRNNRTLPALASNHATQVAGVMVGARNGQGGIGIAYDSTIGGHYLANKGDDLTSLGQMVGYDIANNSWGFSNDFALGNVQDGSISTALALASTARLAATNGRGGLGTIIVAAGGNQRDKGGSAQGSLINNSRYAIEVGAINAKPDLSVLQVAASPFSNPGASLLVSAPGSHVLSSSLALEAERGAAVGSAYSTTQGTSFAAPIVSGVVALMLQANPALAYRDVQQILALSARMVEDPSTDWSQNAARSWNGGSMHVSHDYGFGMIDARAAVRIAESWHGQATKANEGLVFAQSENKPQELAAGQVATLSLSMGAGVQVEHVEIDIHAVVTRLGDLTLTLISPSGTRSVLVDRAGKAPGSSDDDLGNTRTGEFKYGFMSTRHRGEGSEGVWSLEVRNADNGMPLALNRWAVRLSGSPTTSNDTYHFTDEYALVAAGSPGRALLDDAVSGTVGGRNTLNAAAVSGAVAVDLGTGMATIAGAGLTIAPGSLHNLISGDGDDTLIAGPERALLDAGRGRNRLVGGAGADLYVIHRRSAGVDVLENFEVDREFIDLVGFSGKQFSDLQMRQEGSAVMIVLGDGQVLKVADRALADLRPEHFRFKDTFSAPADFFDIEGSGGPAGPSDGTVLLSGGSDGFLFGPDQTGQLVASLAGKVYSAEGTAASVFVVARQEGVDNYKNVLRGFRHGIDRIDLGQLGVSRFEELEISKVYRAMLNEVAQIHGVTVKASQLAGHDKSVQLLYLDSLEVAQVTREDFIFAQPALVTSQESNVRDTGVPQMPAFAGNASLVDPVSTMSVQPYSRPLPNLANLIDAMAGFEPSTAFASIYDDVPYMHSQSTIAVAA